jgi:hypothetical protein
MEILDLVNEKYDKKEYMEIKKLIYIKEQNNDLLENFKNVDVVYNSLLDSLKIQLSEKNQYIEKSNDNFIENNRLFKQVLTNLSHVV